MKAGLSPNAMLTRNTWNPWKILLLVVLACAFVFVTVVATLVHRVAVTRREHEKTVAVVVPDPRQHKPPRPVQEADGNFGNSPPSSNGVGFGGNESSSVPAAGTNLAKNGSAQSRHKKARSVLGEDLFKDELIPVLRIKVASQGVSGLTRSPRKYVSATIQEGATLYTNVAIRLKGGPGSFRPLQDDPAFTLNFDHFAPGQTFHGLKKIHLNNSVQDRSYLCEKISRELFEAAGVPAPRAGHAIVSFNGRELGLHVLVEGVNKQFLKRYFNDVTGNLYDYRPQWDVTEDLPINEGENPRDKSRLRALASAAMEPDLEKRLVSLEKTLDLDRFLSFLAMEMILWHWDGYTMNRNNYRIFHDRDTDRMVFLPHGLDQVLTHQTRPTIFAPAAGLVARSVLEIPEARQRYRERVAQLCTNVFKADALTERIHEVSGKIEAALEEIDPSAAASQHQRAAAFCRKIQARENSLQSLVSPGSLSPTHFGDLATAPLANWQARRDLGEASLAQERDEDGNSLLHIATKEGCTASWRSTALLGKGSYRFEARIKTRGVTFQPNDSRAGAGLRISRYRTGQKNSGDKDWTPIHFDFDVSEDQSEIELICELRAKQGDVWFDLKSLKLKRK